MIPRRWIRSLGLAMVCVALPAGTARAEGLYIGYLKIARPTGIHERHAIGGTEAGVSLAECTRINAEWWAKAGKRLQAANSILTESGQGVEMSLGCEPKK